eukprot:TRINITY_DN68607_c0_g1_i1.p1 TRINITY_DN68607_c0_g1~~TRINITY_DN68607_c0_g1_i1.p1  ORF type:complete len:415 (-),score=68.94 TRINITY_DN68607_c0_g1_i1:470-1714(-)
MFRHNSATSSLFHGFMSFLGERHEHDRLIDSEPSTEFDAAFRKPRARGPRVSQEHPVHQGQVWMEKGAHREVQPTLLLHSPAEQTLPWLPVQSDAVRKAHSQTQAETVEAQVEEVRLDAEDDAEFVLALQREESDLQLAKSKGQRSEAISEMRRSVDGAAQLANEDIQDLRLEPSVAQVVDSIGPENLGQSVNRIGRSLEEINDVVRRSLRTERLASMTSEDVNDMVSPVGIAMKRLRPRLNDLKQRLKGVAEICDELSDDHGTRRTSGQVARNGSQIKKNKAARESIGEETIGSQQDRNEETVGTTVAKTFPTGSFEEQVLKKESMTSKQPGVSKAYMAFDAWMVAVKITVPVVQGQPRQLPKLSSGCSSSERVAMLRKAASLRIKNANAVRPSSRLTQGSTMRHRMAVASFL